MSLINEVNYGMPTTLPPHRAYELRVSPTSGSAATYGAGSVIQVSIPSIPRSFFQNPSAYLTGRVTLAGTMTANAYKTIVSGGAYGMFSKWALRTANGQQIDNIDNPGFIAGAFFNMSMDVGCKIAAANSILLNQTNDTANVGLQINKTDTAGQYNVLDFAIPMIGLFNSDKYWPAFGNELLLELTCNPSSLFVLESGTAQVTGYTISNVEWVCQMLEFTPEVFAQMNLMYQNGIQLKSETYTYGSTIINTGTTGQQDIPFSIRVKSLKRIIAIPSPSGVVEGNGYGAVNPNLNSWNFNLNGQSYPQRPIQMNKPAEAFMQLQRANGAIYSTDKPSLIEINGFRSACTAYITGVYNAYNTTFDANSMNTKPNTCYLVLDTESMVTHKEGLYTGINTSGSTANNIRVDISVSTGVNVNFNYFSVHEAIVSFDFVNGITSVIV